eukprot:TRINITY_DN60358_c0_g1_i1.p1 TRINITY_DN60358_c0_g1~~TRINITY_DN60358_c0_g1_i1.p1  ORF type:complete len:542 (-),score=154.55 TRINITY_DN60358_c0_g1_i1:106-1731(-)
MATYVALRSVRRFSQAALASAHAGAPPVLRCEVNRAVHPAVQSAERRHFASAAVAAPGTADDFFAALAEPSSLDTGTLASSVRDLARIATADTFAEVVDHASFQSLMTTLTERLQQCTDREIVSLADAVARFRKSAAQLSEFSQSLAEEVARRKGAFSPAELATTALALALRGTNDQAAVEFLKVESMRQMAGFEPTHCVMMLEAFRRFGVFEKSFVDALVDQLVNTSERFSSRDIIDTVAVLSRLGLGRGFLLRRLGDMAFQDLGQFTPRELVTLAASLAQLRLLRSEHLDAVLGLVCKDVSSLTAVATAELLFAGGMVDARQQGKALKQLVDHFMRLHTEKKSLTAAVDFSWAMFSLEMHNKHKKELKEVLTWILSSGPPPQSRALLVKLFDVLCALEIKAKSFKIEVPKDWYAACEDANRMDMDKLESSVMHSEVVSRFDNLSGQVNGQRWQLRMLQNQQCGKYRVDMLDEESKVVLDIETIRWPVSRKMKHRHLQDNMGYKPIRLDYWQWRLLQSEEEQNSYLREAVCQIKEECDVL